MNKIFKVIFNHTTQTWMAVSELAKGHCKSSSNSTVEVSDKSEVKGKSFAGIKTIAITSAVMMAVVVPNAFAIQAGSGEIKHKSGQGTAIAGGEATGDSNAIAIGIENNKQWGETRAKAAAPGAIAIGTGSNVTTRIGVALGYRASATGSNNGDQDFPSVAVGGYTNANGLEATAVGGRSQADGRGTASFGANATANGEGATAVGFKSNATNAGATAVGTNSLANGETATAVGGNSNATGKGAVALGANTTTSGEGSTAIGFLSKSTAAGGTAIGMNTTVGTGVAIGRNASASNGRSDKASVAIGVDAMANGELGTAIGRGAISESGETVALGSGAHAGGAYHNHGVALGAKSKANHEGGVALGYDSKTEEAKTSKNLSVKNDSGTNVNSSDFAGASVGGSPWTGTKVVSVGNEKTKRQIINVAAGRVSETSTDAINGSQLYQAMKHTGFNIQQNGSTKSRINNDGLVNFTDGDYTTAVVTDGDNSSSVKMNVVTQGISTDAKGMTSVSGNTAGLTTAETVSGAINSALNNSSFLLKANGDAGEKITRNSEINIKSGNNSNINVSRNGSTITIKTVDNPNFSNVTANGSLTVSDKSNLRGDVLLGGEGKTITFQGKSNVDMGGNKIANVANGTEKTDAVNKGQLDAVSTVANAANTTANAANTTANTANSTANAANTTANTANTTANAANTTANTANTTANTANTTANTANTTANAANTTANTANTTANTALNKVNKGWNINTGKAEGGNVEGNSSTNVQMGDTVKVIAGKNLNITQNGKDITLSVNDSPNFTSITTSNGASIGGDLTVNGTTKTKDLNVTNNANIEKNLTVKGDSTVKGNSTIEGTTTTKDLNVTNNANIEKNLTVKGNSTVEGTTTTKDLNVTNNATVNNLTATNGTITNLTSENGTFSKNLTSTGETLLSGNTTIGGQDKTFTVANGTKVDMGGNVISNITDGNISAGSKDAITGGQLHSTIQNITTNLTNQGMNFTGNNGVVVTRKLGETLTVQGSLAENKEADSSNIRTVANATTGAIEIVMAKDPTFRNLTATGNTTVGGDLGVNGTTTTKNLNVTNNANIEKDLTVKGNSTVDGNSTVNGTTTTKD
ncbi:ESPR-type extended signal peptide-containing protein, partial [Rodentibacter pneumotropicus]